MKTNKFVIIPIILVAAFAIALIISNFLSGTGVNLGPIFGSIAPDCSVCGWAYGACGCGGNPCERPKICPQNPNCNTCVAATFCDDCSGTSSATCTPNCVGKNCGSNGCSGSCGTCSAGKNCVNGNCASPDTQAPFFYKQSENVSAITQNGAVLLSVYWTDNVSLSTAQLVTNETGDWKFTSHYGSPIKYTAGDAGDWSNFTWSNSSIPIGTLVGWEVFANDTSNNINTSDVRLFEIVQTTTTTTASTTTTTATATGRFSASNFACSSITGGWQCNITYSNNLGENAVVIFLVSNKDGDVVSSTSPVATQAATNIGTTFQCSSLTSGTYYVYWTAYKQSDTSYSNPVAFSKSTERQVIVC